jgi:hypothetical protein
MLPEGMLHVDPSPPGENFARKTKGRRDRFGLAGGGGLIIQVEFVEDGKTKGWRVKE